MQTPNLQFIRRKRIRQQASPFARPTKSTAARLGLSLGTVKSYGRRPYDKLDITTEREIFLAFIAASRRGL